MIAANINEQQPTGVISVTDPGAHLLQQSSPEIVPQVTGQALGYPLQPTASCPIERMGCPLQQPHYYSPQLGYPSQQQNYNSGWSINLYLILVL